VLTYSRYAPEKIPYGIKRYQEETRRLFDVVEDGLKAGKGEYLVGDKYSIVDISSKSSVYLLASLIVALLLSCHHSRRTPRC